MRQGGPHGYVVAAAVIFGMDIGRRDVSAETPGAIAWDVSAETSSLTGEQRERVPLADRLE